MAASKVCDESLFSYPFFKTMRIKPFLKFYKLKCLKIGLESYITLLRPLVNTLRNCGQAEETEGDIEVKIVHWREPSLFKVRLNEAFHCRNSELGNIDIMKA